MVTLKVRLAARARIRGQVLTSFALPWSATKTTRDRSLGSSDETFLTSGGGGNPRLREIFNPLKYGLIFLKNKTRRRILFVTKKGNIFGIFFLKTSKLSGTVEGRLGRIPENLEFSISARNSISNFVWLEILPSARVRKVRISTLCNSLRRRN